MSGVPEPQAYFAEAASWDSDRAAGFRAAARTAWRVAAAACLCAVACAVSLALLMPLKRVDPFVVRVDNSTGVVDVVPLYVGNEPHEELVTRYFLTHYVSVCERFNHATAESDYEECGAFHGAERNQDWYALWTRNNPASPLNVHKDGSIVRVQVSAVSFFARSGGPDELAQVRYLKALRPAAGAEEKVSHWIANIQYRYGPPADDPRTRRWNPLGFKVMEFSTEPEAEAAAPAAIGKGDAT